MRSARPTARTGAAMLSIGLAVLAAGCDSGGGTGTGVGPVGSAPGSTAPPAAESTAAPASRYQGFDQVPGPTITHWPGSIGGGRLTLDVKPMTTAWTPQFQSEPADSDAHFLVVYMAVTTTAKDRGLPGARLHDVRIRYADTTYTRDTCRTGQARPAGGYCSAEAETRFVSELIPLTSDWETHRFAEREYTGTDLVPGLAYAAVGAYEIPDDLRPPGGFQLCGAEGVTGSDTGEAPQLCIPLDTPARR